MFIYFTPHSVTLKPELIKELIELEILKENRDYTKFPVIAMDIKTEKQSVVDKDKIDDMDEDEIRTKEVEVSEIMLLIGIPDYGYYWVDQDETVYFNS